MNKYVITQEVIKECFEGMPQSKGMSSEKFTLLLAIFCIVFGSILNLLYMADWVFLGTGMFFWALAILILVLRHRDMGILKQIKSKKYFLRTDICLDKNYTYSEIDEGIPYLIFAKTGKRELIFPWITFSSRAMICSPNLYETTKRDDVFYLLCDKDGNVLYIFNSRFWDISDKSFKKSKDLYVPKK